MRRTFSALALALTLSGCAALGSSLPYHSSSIEDSMGMTIEQYAVGRLPAGSQGKLHCAKREAPKPDQRRHTPSKGCRTR